MVTTSRNLLRSVRPWVIRVISGPSEEETCNATLCKVTLDRAQIVCVKQIYVSSADPCPSQISAEPLASQSSAA